MEKVTLKDVCLAVFGLALLAFYIWQFVEVLTNGKLY